MAIPSPDHKVSSRHGMLQNGAHVFHWCVCENICTILFPAHKSPPYSVM